MCACAHLLFIRFIPFLHLCVHKETPIAWSVMHIPFFLLLLLLLPKHHTYIHSISHVMLFVCQFSLPFFPFFPFKYMRPGVWHIIKKLVDLYKYRFYCNEFYMWGEGVKAKKSGSTGTPCAQCEVSLSDSKNVDPISVWICIDYLSLPWIPKHKGTTRACSRDSVHAIILFHY